MQNYTTSARIKNTINNGNYTWLAASQRLPPPRVRCINTWPSNPDQHFEGYMQTLHMGNTISAILVLIMQQAPRTGFLGSEN